MTAPTLPAAITEAISAIRCDARFGDTIRALESTIAPWLAIVREVAKIDPVVRYASACGDLVRECGCCCRTFATEKHARDPAEHMVLCVWARAKMLVGSEPG